MRLCLMPQRLRLVPLHEAELDAPEADAPEAALSAPPEVVLGEPP